MQQINPNLTVITVGEVITPDLAGALKIFLTGSIAFNDKADWQGKFINSMTKLTDPIKGDKRFNNIKFLIINPKASVQNPEMSLANQEYTQKTQWEFQMMQQVDGIFCNFLKKGQNPLALSQFLLNAGTQRIVCRCPAEFQFYPMINLTCLNYGIPLLGDSGTSLNVLEKFFEMIPKFQEIANYGLQ